MKEYYKNPRRLSEKQYALLKRDLAELGDLGGIVHDLNSDEIIGGNQRSKIIVPSKANITITDTFDPPTKTGTVAIGYIEWQGERYQYRQVRWSEKQCEKANIVANKAGGEWNYEVLANEFEYNDLLEYGFDESDLLRDTFKKNFTADIDSIDEVMKYPITVVANEDEYQMYEQIKERTRAKTDNAVFLKLMKYYLGE